MIRVALTAALDASGDYRIRKPAAMVAERFGDQFSVQIGNLRQHEIGTFDLLVLQRPMYWFMPDVIAEVRRHGVPVIIELDDDFHSATSKTAWLNNPKLNREQNWNHLSACLRLCDHVTVSTPALAQRYGSHGRVSVLRNAVDDAWLDIPHVDNGQVLGWTGSTRFHHGDPEVTHGAIDHVLCDNPQWRFECIGAERDHDETAEAFGLSEFAQKTRFGTQPIRDLQMHPYVLTSLDLGIVPLAHTAFNRAKSWLKGIEYAALGIPFVASDLPEYRKLQEYGIGYCVENKARKWQRALSLYMEDASGFRRESGLRQRKMVREHLTMSQNAWRWAAIWNEVYTKGVRDGRSPRGSTTRA